MKPQLQPSWKHLQWQQALVLLCVYEYGRRLWLPALPLLCLQCCWVCRHIQHCRSLPGSQRSMCHSWQQQELCRLMLLLLPTPPLTRSHETLWTVRHAAAAQRFCLLRRYHFGRHQLSRTRAFYKPDGLLH
jgi:hypothetical protein